ncbi:MAG TPA: DUF1844 domain-containing protein [Candidatus Polarisedimenticolaceae bacterium]|nr:DUF1844 domain-containing protein [Candidatus Polarisedimenticolaceae bacterium]
MAGEEEKKEGKGFTVQDRRRFSETGDSRDDARSSTDAGDRVETKATEDSTSQPPGKADEQQTALPEINFSTFVISLSTQALMHLGEIANPLTGKVEPDRPVAKQMIDIIGMLREKTRGNLNSGEDRLIEDILFDLRMKYVEAVKKK